MIEGGIPIGVGQSSSSALVVMAALAIALFGGVMPGVAGFVGVVTLIGAVEGVAIGLGLGRLMTPADPYQKMAEDMYRRYTLGYS